MKVDIFKNDFTNKLEAFVTNPGGNDISNWVAEIMDSLSMVGVRNTGAVLEGLFCNFAYELAEKWDFEWKYQPPMEIRSKKKGDFSWSNTKNGKKVIFEIKNLIDQGGSAQSIETLQKHRKEIGKNPKRTMLVVGYYVYHTKAFALEKSMADVKNWMFVRWKSYGTTECSERGLVPFPELKWSNQNAGKIFNYKIYNELSGSSFIETAFLTAKKFLKS